ncbi:hypothetical protein [Streptomyces chryseus]|uniref:hypothetical protein n=1 Tax=Streptomyces chryseus TaxID=68186 RepID=UPI00110FECE8|nr:hypothetical protein [Streptomyces chryseus]GGX10210.1 hypothetical protein GCM10010353_27090 [Streptomyces chryseus]
MKLTDPLKYASLALGLYGVCVLVLRFGRDGMGWGQALLIGVVVTPVVYLWSRLRDRLNRGAGDAGRRWRARRRA